MERELKTMVVVCLLVIVSLSYCYEIGKVTSKATTRLLCFIPVVFLFLFLPLYLSSVHFGGGSAFLIAWLANFKLLLFAFGKGPLSIEPAISLGRFLAISCLPSEVVQKKSKSPHQNDKNIEFPSLKTPKKGQKSALHCAIKILVFSLILNFNDHLNIEDMSPAARMLLFCCLMYIMLDLGLALMATFARALLGTEIEPQFDEPYLSTSLQDFWGRRWNLVVSSILRQAVFKPTCNMLARVFGHKWAPAPAVVATFGVSGIMHELIFYYLGRVRPTWEVTCFFLLHGVWLIAEVAMKMAFAGKWQFPTLVSQGLTLGFLGITGYALFFPQLIRCSVDVRTIDEYTALRAFVKKIIRTL